MANTTTQEKKKRSLLNTTAGSDPITTIAKTEEGKRQAKDIAGSINTGKAPSIGGGLTPDKFSGITTSTFAGDTPEELLQRQELRGVRQQMQIIGDGGREAATPVNQPQLQEELAGRGTFDNVNIEQNSLEPTHAKTAVGELVEGLPLVGNMLRAMATASAEIKKKLGIASDRDKEFYDQAGDLELQADYEGTRDKALQKITNKEIRKGLTLKENVGAIIEAIPGSAFLDGLVGGRLETPSGNVATLTQTINDMRERGTNLVEKVNKGFPVDVAMDQVQDMQDEVAEMEGEMRLLINQSAILRSDSDRVNQIEEDIERAKVLLEANRVILAVIQVKQASGTGTPIPTDIQLYNMLNE